MVAPPTEDAMKTPCSRCARPRGAAITTSRRPRPRRRRDKPPVGGQQAAPAGDDRSEGQPEPRAVGRSGRAVRHQAAGRVGEPELRLRQGRAHARGPHRARSARHLPDDRRAQGQAVVADRPRRSARHRGVQPRARLAARVVSVERTSCTSAWVSPSSPSPRAARSMRPGTDEAGWSEDRRVDIQLKQS